MNTLRCVDLFAGAGGFSTGARQAGAQVLWAANHWKPAVQTHAENHPETEHLCQDLHQADWTKVPEHDLLLASPACQGHSKARGKDKPSHDATRATAFAVLGAVDWHRPPFLLVENVREFLSWDGYRGWKTILQDFGYELTEQVLDAADFGVPQHRERLFICGTRRGALELKAPKVPHVPAASIIDWDYPAWSPIATPRRSLATLGRIARARLRGLGERFLVAYYGGEKHGRPLSKPLGTITTRARFAVVDGPRMRMLNTQEVRKAMGFPEEYRLPGPCRDHKGEPLTAHEAAVYMLGNAVPPPVARELVSQIQRVA